MSGGAGNDLYIVANIGDRVIEVSGEGIDKVMSSVSHTLADHVENLVLTGAANIAGTGNELANQLIGNRGNNILNGGLGADKLTGGGGNDRLLGGGGNDNLIGGIGRDQLTGGRGQDRLVGGNGDDSLGGDGGNNMLFGGNGKDILIGGAGNDHLVGGAGKDRLAGGGGADHFIFNTMAESKVPGTSRDVITDFRQLQGDIIDLSSIDANMQMTADQAFRFLGTGQFNNKAGELRYQFQKENTLIFGDVDGDGRADFSIELLGTVNLAEQDFIL